MGADRRRASGLVAALVGLVALGGCRPLDRCCDPADFEDTDVPLAVGNGPGVALSFDDAYIDAWAGTADLLEEHGAVATFFVTRLDRLSEEQLDQLRELEALGHEIGCHGHRHQPAGQIERRHGTETWVTDDILPALDAFAAAGFAPSSFSFPYGEHTDGTGEAALRYFDHVRGSRFIGPIPEVADVDAVFLPAEELPRRRFSCAFAIDERYGISEERLDRALDRAAERGEVLALYGHEPVDGATQGFQTSHALLTHVLAGAGERSLRFYRYSEFADTR